MAKLARAVHVTDPHSGRRLVLQPGEEPAAHLSALITMPSAWEGGRLPDLEEAPADGDDGKDDSSSQDSDGTPETVAAKKTAPAAKKTAATKRAATSPARGRGADEKGDGGA